MKRRYGNIKKNKILMTPSKTAKLSLRIKDLKFILNFELKRGVFPLIKFPQRN